MKHRGGQIELPWPHKILWPNGRTRSYYFRNAEFQKHKAWAWAAAKEAKLVAPDGRIPILFTFCPKPTGQAPDKDNALASAKAYADGIAKAMGVDDRLFDPDVAIGERGGIVRVSIGGGE
jgi:crossover junction endodeoxyribonuclease RusA